MPSLTQGKKEFHFIFHGNVCLSGHDIAAAAVESITFMAVRKKRVGKRGKKCTTFPLHIRDCKVKYSVKETSHMQR